MSLNFPSAPTLGQIYPVPPVNGVSQYTWDGEKWTVANASGPSNANPLMDGAVAPGTGIPYSREDHRHPKDSAKMDVAGGQTTTGGFRFTAYNAGTISSGNFQPNSYNGNYQYYSNAGGHTWVAPANDCAVDVLMTNAAGAGGISLSGFTIGSNTGDLITLTVGHRFIISFRRINGVSTYVVKALQ